VTDDRSYDAGHAAGVTDARLSGHDQHFARINGSIERMAGELAGVKLALQRLADAADSDRHTVVATATALKAAEEARRALGTDRWQPWQKAVALIGGAGTLIGIVVLVLTNWGN
jgi:hypothetical protein